MSLFRLGARVGCSSPDASPGLEEWPPSHASARWTEPGLQALWRYSTRRYEEQNEGTKRCALEPSCFLLLRVFVWNQFSIFNASCRWLVRLDGQAEEIGRLGIPAVALLWRQGAACGAGAPVRPSGLQRDRRQARAQGPAQPRALVLLRSARRRIQQELELFRGPQSGRSRSPRG